MSRLFKSKNYWITQEYHSGHRGIDMTAEGGFDYVTAHTEGSVIQVVDNCNINTSGSSTFGSNSSLKDSNNPGNMVVIKHNNGYTTRYLHLKYGSVAVKVGDYVAQGDVLGYMGNTGYSFGAHLHWDMSDENGLRINPTVYLDSDLPGQTAPETYDVGDRVEIDGVYVSSTSEKRLNPLIRQGTITRIVPGARNPYLLDNGNIGWINEDCIVKHTSTGTVHIVQPGENLSLIASKYGTTWQAIYEKNYAVIGNNPNLIYPGTKLVI